MKKKRERPTSRGIKRRLLAYLIAAALLLGVVLYLSFSRTLIVITPKILKVPLKTTITVGSATPEEGETSEQTAELSGIVLAIETEASMTFENLEATSEEPARAGGTVRIVNNWSKVQPLAAGTRLLSESGVLFRTTERVDVPVGGSIDAQVLADQPGKDGEIRPSRFEIVALWEGLKPLIYAENTEAFSGGTTSVATITDEHLATAKEETRRSLERQGRELLENELVGRPEASTFELVAFQTATTDEQASAKVGDEASRLTFSIKGTVTGVALERPKLLEQLTQVAAKEIGADRRLLTLPGDAQTMTVKEGNASANAATLEIASTADAALTTSSSVLDRGAVAGKDRQDILSYFAQFDEIASAEVHFSPFWVFRAPTLADHIDIRLADPVP